MFLSLQSPVVSDSSRSSFKIQRDTERDERERRTVDMHIITNKEIKLSCSSLYNMFVSLLYRFLINTICSSVKMLLQTCS